jgi:hypothetical protein
MAAGLRVSPKVTHNERLVENHRNAQGRMDFTFSRIGPKPPQLQRVLGNSRETEPDVMIASEKK